MKIRALAALALAFSFFPLFACGRKNSSYASDETPPFESTFDSESAENEADTSTSENASSSNDSSVSTPEPPNSSSPPSTPIQKTASYVRCTADSVNIRSGAGTSFSALGSAEKGTVYAVTEKTGNWYKTYYRGKTAYIYASYFSAFTLQKSSDSDVEDVIAEGYKLIGTPYVYGAIRLHDGKGKLLKGFSTNKFDCSSLIQYIFYKGAGELLQVNTRTQVTQGKFVPKSELKRGDCIYFTNAEREHKTGVERIGHVALYLGNDYILHTASDYARIEKMTAKRWSYYVEARRFL